MKVTRPLAAVLVCLGCTLPSHAQEPRIRIRRALQIEEVQAVEEVREEAVEVAEKIEDEQKAGGSGPSGEDTAEEEEEAAPPAAPLDPQFLRVRLMDGSVLSGTLAIKEITVETEFGELQVPIESIRTFQPGLKSHPELAQKLEAEIAKLGSEQDSERDAARRALVRMGTSILPVLRKTETADNEQLAKQVKSLVTELESLAEEEAIEDDASNNELSQLDRIETTDFTMLGRISPSSFKMASKYGPLTVQLDQIRVAERNVGGRAAMRKKVGVQGQNLAQLGFKESGLKLERGDTVRITASGQIMMTPWGSNAVSTPDGNQNYGFYNEAQVPGGTLLGKIGDSGKIFKVGAKSTFTADRAGELKFAIAMQQDFAQGNYQFPGEYKVDVRVDPK